MPDWRFCKNLHDSTAIAHIFAEIQISICFLDFQWKICDKSFSFRKFKDMYIYIYIYFLYEHTDFGNDARINDEAHGN